MILAMTTIWPLSFLVVAIIDDLWFKKFHNWLFLSLCVVGLTIVVFTGHISYLHALGGFAVGALCMLPLVLVNAIGAGDMKFMMCFGIIMGTLATFEIFIYALFWGALIGVLQSLFAGNILKLINNLKLMSFKMRPTQLSKIPYTVAIFFGWMTHVTYGGLL